MKLLKQLFTISLFLLMTHAIAQDWPGLQKYQQENALLSTLDQNEQRIVFMGNSITEGWKNFNPGFFEKNGYINRGYSGQTTPQMLIRFRQDVVDIEATVVVILAGINDIAGNTGPSTLEMIQDNIKSMCEIAKSNDIKVVLCSVLPAYDFPWSPGLQPAEKVVKLNSFLRNYAQKEGFVYVDYFSAMKNDKNGLQDDLGSDGIHPNKKGYDIMQPIVVKGIKNALN